MTTPGPLFEFTLTSSGVAHDADGNLLDPEGNPIPTAPEES
jgi:hypothetical protein